MADIDPLGADAGNRAGLRGIGGPLEGTDARPSDLVAERRTLRPDLDEQGGLNEQQDELRAHAAAQGAEGELEGGLDDTRASRTQGSMNDNGNL